MNGDVSPGGSLSGVDDPDADSSYPPFSLVMLSDGNQVPVFTPSQNARQLLLSVPVLSMTPFPQI